MKKLFFILALFILFGSLAFADTAEQEEIDFLLFFPNSSNQFVNTEQANIQLDNLAKYLKEKNLVPGQIGVYGYAAVAENEIEPISLSMNRAVFVINELQKRGVSKDLFSDPVAYGAVNLWGSNSNEETRIPNRRVRILLDGDFLTPVIIQATEHEPAPAIIEDAVSEPGFKFPWKLLLLLLLIPLIILLMALRRKKPVASTEEKPLPASPALLSQGPIAVAADESVLDLDEEIRRRAYELFEQRHGQNGDMDGDWYMAVCEICPRYEKAGYKVSIKGEHWMAAITKLRR